MGGPYRHSGGRKPESIIVPVAATVLPFDQATSKQTERIQKLNRWIRKAADHEHIPFADLAAAVVDPQNPARLNGSPDGLHPDIGGYRKMGMALIKIIDEMEAARAH
jgi:lysophospholipase L1-like esterase